MEVQRSPVGLNLKPRWALTPAGGVDVVALGLLALGLCVLFLPTLVDVARTIWTRDEQGHGPIILAVTAWLVYRKRDELFALEPSPSPLAGSLWLALGLLMFVLGRSQAVLLLSMGALIPVLIALLLLLIGPAAVRLLWFPLFFLLFMVPLPATLVIAVTTPLKSAVSAVASALLYHLGYPVGRSGVVLTVGPYQLLVADACAGLNSMFTLEALGLLYMNVMSYASKARNLAMAIAIVPISFVANIVRVCILVLVTYHFGDEAGQGFVHGFAGMVLFLVALTLILAFDHGMTGLVRRVKRLGKA
ncbi:exosortase B [Roseateles paludis]|uniref:Exosortase B n=1 Tax=Roseateles paludis TaxID=3145238 RepID=A0ABV0G6M5_9BURK